MKLHKTTSKISCNPRLGLKIKGLFAFLAWKLGEQVGQSFFFFFFFWLIRTQKKCNFINVCAFLGMQSLRIGLILVLEMVVFQYIWLNTFLGQILYILTFYLNVFVEKYKVEHKKKKKKKKQLTHVNWFFGSVRKKGKQTSIFLGLPFFSSEIDEAGVQQRLTMFQFAFNSVSSH